VHFHATEIKPHPPTGNEPELEGCELEVTINLLTQEISAIKDEFPEVENNKKDQQVTSPILTCK
jgi:hypothetical protein